MRLLYQLATSIKLDSLPNPSGVTDNSEVQTVLQIVFAFVGALAFLFLVIAGFRYIISTGDPQDTEKAKNGVIYALVGVLLALFAEAIVTWVVGNVGK